MPVAELNPSDIFHLRAAVGWLELGNPTEAGEEIARISSDAIAHPDVLEVRWQICAATQSWDAATPVGEQLVSAAPERVSGWIHRAYAIRRATHGGLQKAWEALLPAASLFPKDPLIAYNLACYAAQFGRLDDAWEWLTKALSLADDAQAMKEMALADHDLEPLWDRIRVLRDLL
jgi:Flp pilus assembly protein TadD